MSDNAIKLIQYLDTKYHLHNQLNSLDQIQELMIFGMFWNQIEKWTQKWLYQIIFELINQKITDSREIDSIGNYFIWRYRDWIHRFDSLKNMLPKVSKAEKIRHQKYLGKISNNHLFSFDEKKELIAYIIYRFRNRLFHWEKPILEDQNENFKVINTFLHYLLTK